jgi:hypothetical protein
VKYEGEEKYEVEVKDEEEKIIKLWYEEKYDEGNVY